MRSRRRKALTPAGYHFDAAAPVVLPCGSAPCRWCRGPVVPPRRSFCGPACVDQWKLRTDYGYLRGRLFARDRGVCYLCGLDAAPLDLGRCHARVLRAAAASAAPERRWRAWAVPPPLDAAGGLLPVGAMLAAYRQALAWHVVHRLDPARSPWEADHVVPLAAGGSGGLENVATACRPCHAAKTAAENAARAGRKGVTNGRDVL